MIKIVYKAVNRVKNVLRLNALVSQSVSQSQTIVFIMLIRVYMSINDQYTYDIALIH